MKIRNGFVSNSSSSSFIVIDGNQVNQEKIDKVDLILKSSGDVVKFPLEYGQHEFGWEFKKYNSWDDKLNFAFLQAMTGEKYLELFKEYVNELFGIKITYKLNEYGKINYDEGYIDHQSMGYEKPVNLEMFDSLEKFKKFIFNDESYVEMGNDNV